VPDVTPIMNEEALESALALPFTPIPEKWTVSFSQIDDDFFYITLTVERPNGGKSNFLLARNMTCICQSKPSESRVVQFLLESMIAPKLPAITGHPHRPCLLFVAYSYKYAFSYIEEFMGRIGIACLLETKEQAKETCAKHDTHYKGKNYKCCIQCQRVGVPLSRCAGCDKVFYCSRACQKSDWNEHKLYCYKESRTAAQVFEAVKNLTVTHNNQDEGRRSHNCAKCNQSNAIMNICTRCKIVFYCNRACQKADWKRHKPNCRETVV